MKRLILAIGVTAALTTTFAGCGSKTETAAPAATTTTAAPKQTKAELITKADAICKEYATKRKAIPEPKAEADLGEYLDKNLELAKEQIGKIKDLGEPADEAAAWNAALAKQTSFIELLEKKLPDLKKDPSAIASDTEITAAEKESNQAAKDFGLKECGKS